MTALSESQRERIKLTASFLNTIAAGFLISGVIVPIIGAVYAGSELSRWNLGVGVTIQLVLIVSALLLHIKARDNLRELDR